MNIKICNTLALLLTIIFIGPCVNSIYSAYVKHSFKSREVINIHKKFGTPPSGSILYDSFIRLSDPTRGSSCSGWVIDANYAITAGHCLNQEGHLNKSNFYIFDKNGTNTNTIAQAVGYDNKTDLGLISSDFNHFKPLKSNLDQEGFTLNKHSFVSCGFPLGQKTLVCTPFTSSGFRSFRVKGFGHFVPGMSGGPVIDLDSGVAVGVVVSVDDNYSFVAPIEGILGLFNVE